MAISFEKSYEQTITDIQLQEQLRVTKEFELSTKQVEKQIDLLESIAEATVERIDAQAEREKAIIINEARAEARVMVQTTKAEMYKVLRTHFNWTQGQAPSKMKLGIEATGSMMQVGV